ncbi:hypothetical protein HK097_002689 [Rhizophlyctis rosea]|uniref:Uncharacterized protein n=1 Tax=Rhizophlyctis rosea TaxID=64517 RepID=A0AAD5S338_9FUNG|nr:hypothetical protein HK097_002689 [Rhizophlyctis rosea]
MLNAKYFFETPAPALSEKSWIRHSLEGTVFAEASDIRESVTSLDSIWLKEVAGAKDLTFFRARVDKAKKLDALMLRGTMPKESLNKLIKEYKDTNFSLASAKRKSSQITGSDAEVGAAALLHALDASVTCFNTINGIGKIVKQRKLSHGAELFVQSPPTSPLKRGTSTPQTTTEAVTIPNNGEFGDCLTALSSAFRNHVDQKRKSRPPFFAGRYNRLIKSCRSLRASITHSDQEIFSPWSTDIIMLTELTKAEMLLRLMDDEDPFFGETGSKVERDYVFVMQSIAATKDTKPEIVRRLLESIKVPEVLGKDADGVTVADDSLSSISPLPLHQILPVVEDVVNDVQDAIVNFIRKKRVLKRQLRDNGNDRSILAYYSVFWDRESVESTNEHNKDAWKLRFQKEFELEHGVVIGGVGAFAYLWQERHMMWKDELDSGRNRAVITLFEIVGFLLSLAEVGKACGAADSSKGVTESCLDDSYAKIEVIIRLFMSGATFFDNVENADVVVESSVSEGSDTESEAEKMAVEGGRRAGKGKAAGDAVGEADYNKGFVQSVIAALKAKRYICYFGNKFTQLGDETDIETKVPIVPLIMPNGEGAVAVLVHENKEYLTTGLVEPFVEKLESFVSRIDRHLEVEKLDVVKVEAIGEARGAVRKLLLERATKPTA